MNYLHHYTSIESVKEILKNQTIRFNNLGRVNDTNEGETYEFGNVGKYIFVSCWTDNDKEDIPMWNIYGNNMKGIRLSVPYPIFPKYYDKRLGSDPMLVKLDDSIFSNYLILPTVNNKFSVKIDYTNEQEKLNPITSLNIGDLDVFKLGAIGVCKSKSWSFEQEIRFIIYTFPTIHKMRLDKDFDTLNFFGSSIDLIKENYDIGISYIDLKIDSKLMNKIILTTGPLTDTSMIDDLKSFRSKFGLNFEINDSELRNKVR